VTPNWSAISAKGDARLLQQREQPFLRARAIAVLE
jgi:hypothetical protein